MSSGSLKEAAKGLTAVFGFSTPPPYPLPDEVQDAVDSYLDKHKESDAHESQRVQDELLSIFHRNVTDQPEKQLAFLNALALLRPAIQGTERWLEWWDLIIRRTVTALGQEKAVVEETRRLLLSILVYDKDEDPNGERAQASAVFAQKLLEAYLDRTRLHVVGENVNPAEQEANHFVSDHLESILVDFGKRKPKEFMDAVDILVVNKNQRVQALSLLCAFVRCQPPHLYEVSQTALIEHLLKCLMIDTSTTVVSLALTTLVMFLPHIPSSLVNYLPRLFVVYSRVLCWEAQNGQTAIDGHDSEKDDGYSSSPEMARNSEYTDPSWDKLENSFGKMGSMTPELAHYFTFLYGLYPLNFMNFIRQPYVYLENFGFKDAKLLDLDPKAIRNRSEQFRQMHLLHPNFYNLTAEMELADNRWVKSDPSDVVIECMGLQCAVLPATVLNDPGPPPTSKLPDIPESSVPTEDIPVQSLLSADEGAESPASPTDTRTISWRNTQVTLVPSHAGSLPSDHHTPTPGSHRQSLNQAGSRTASPYLKPRDPILDSPTLPPHTTTTEVTTLQTQGPPRKNSVQSNYSEGAASLRALSLQSPRLEAFPLAPSHSYHKVPRSPAIRAASIGGETSAAFLQREVMLLRNDLNFERYLRQQHLSHIGQLQRRHIKEATAEAETQRLLNTNRALKVKLEDAKQSFAMLKKETMTSKHNSKKWEAELNSKVRILREDQKRWKSDEDTLRRELSGIQVECDRLRKLIVDSEAREFRGRQRVQSIETNMEEVENLRAEVDNLNARIQEYQAKEDEVERIKVQDEDIRVQLETVNLRLRSQDTERERVKRAYERRVADLETMVQSSQAQTPDQNSPAIQHMLDSALASSRMRFNQLKKAHNLLLNRYTELEVRLQDMQTGGGGAEFDDDLAFTLNTRPIAGFSSALDGHAPLRSSSKQAGSAMAQLPGPLRRHPTAPPDLSKNPDDYYGGGDDYYTSSPSLAPSPAAGGPGDVPRPQRFESLRNHHGHGHYASGDSSPVYDRFDRLHPASGPSSRSQSRTAYDSPAESTAPRLSSAGNSRRSSLSGDRASSAKDTGKIGPFSEARVYGRGGVQNIGKREKPKDGKKRGIRALIG
ncbi:hypothetical protein L228DRAFT_237714 [Xylona heveae TC161]|uniref:Hamartin-domain-containing protein n=1 Tax=Xylona heveae (strain CBS 132557 / TC161) TaxID=1328760 RepID=A0A165H845_XYLHT|nr:hypothetical protein L228DRAFT_237714 [Xylona heveae TC161]KZF23116.1 hypothetical protein L228DRAFT_237714 [Xylona heveae TC161]